MMEKLKRLLENSWFRFGLIVVLALLLMSRLESNAKSQFNEPTKIRTTCYTWTGNRCANGDYPTQGITIAWKREYIGYSVILYEVNKDGSCGDMIGIYEIEDTGGSCIRSGQRLDMYRDNDSEVNKWISQFGDYTYMQLVKSKG